MSNVNGILAAVGAGEDSDTIACNNQKLIEKFSDTLLQRSAHEEMLGQIIHLHR